MTDLTEQEVCIGSLGQQKVYLHWSDVKDICTYAVSAAYEQTKRENAQLKELLKDCRIANETLVGIMDWLRQSVIPEQRDCCEELFVKVQKLQTLIDEVLK